MASLPENRQQQNDELEQTEAMRTSEDTEFVRKESVSGFREERFACEICLQTVLGAVCEKLHPCGHVHCVDCLSTHIVYKIESGSVTKIDCPNSACAELISASIVQRLVPADIFSHYDRLLKKRKLEARKDIAFYPQPMCEGVAPKEDESDLATCPSCDFAFASIAGSPDMAPLLAKISRKT